jgi:hypothetical protein
MLRRRDPGPEPGAVRAGPAEQQLATLIVREQTTGGAGKPRTGERTAREAGKEGAPFHEISQLSEFLVGISLSRSQIRRQTWELTTRKQNDYEIFF